MWKKRETGNLGLERWSVLQESAKPPKAKRRVHPREILRIISSKKEVTTITLRLLDYGLMMFVKVTLVANMVHINNQTVAINAQTGRCYSLSGYLTQKSMLYKEMTNERD